MFGSVYCVLFSDGTVKAGFTAGEQQKRIKAHFQSAKSFGLKVDVALFTEMHDGADRTEQGLMGFFRERLNPRSSEYFSGANYSIVREAMIETKKLVGWTFTSGTAKGCMLVPPKLIGSKIARSDDGIEKRILSLIKKHASTGITIGVIKNRFRGKEIEGTLDEMVNSGKIETKVHAHAKTGVDIEAYWPTS